MAYYNIKLYQDIDDVILKLKLTDKSFHLYFCIFQGHLVQFFMFFFQKIELCTLKGFDFHCGLIIDLFSISFKQHVNQNVLQPLWFNFIAQFFFSSNHGKVHLFPYIGCLARW